MNDYVCESDIQQDRPAPKKKGMLLWIILAGVVLLTAIFAVLDLTDVLDLGILGPKHITRQYSVLKEEITYKSDGTETSRTTVEVNRDGLPVTITTQSADNRLKNIMEISYYSNGQVRQLDRRSFWDEKQNAHSLYKCDKNGNLLKETHVSPNTAEQIVEYEYDKNGNILEKTIFQDGKEYGPIEYEYDENGNLLSVGSTKYKYDDQGRLSEITSTNNFGAVTHTKYEYDGNGRLLKKTLRGSTLMQYEYEYDDQGKLTSINCSSGGEAAWYITYTWYDAPVDMGQKSAQTINKILSLSNDPDILAEK